MWLWGACGAPAACVAVSPASCPSPGHPWLWLRAEGAAEAKAEALQPADPSGSLAHSGSGGVPSWWDTGSLPAWLNTAGGRLGPGNGTWDPAPWSERLGGLCSEYLPECGRATFHGRRACLSYLLLLGAPGGADGGAPGRGRDHPRYRGPRRPHGGSRPAGRAGRDLAWSVLCFPAGRSGWPWCVCAASTFVLSPASRSAQGRAWEN